MTQQKIPSIALSPVKSSQILALGHDPATNTLAVQFKNGTYHYKNVDAQGFEAFSKAKSIGSHFAQHIKGNNKHPFIKLPTEQKK